VNHGAGPLLVVAGPGSGKTRVLTERVRRLLTKVPGHFRILALTFTNKAASEMHERLKDLGETMDRAFIGTLHGFCLQMLTERGKPLGVTGTPQIFEHAADRKGVLLEAIAADPVLQSELMQAGDQKARSQRLDAWLRGIAVTKAHPLSQPEPRTEIERHVLEAYNTALKACGAHDFEDLLLLSYRLLTQFPRVAEFYRRLYEYVCIDEAQDLNEAQYGVITALCGEETTNVMMVGDPKQSIYGFNTSSPKFMDQFQEEFGADRIVLTENFRSSRAVVGAAQALEPSYSIEGQLPIKGHLGLLVGRDETEEAELIEREIRRLLGEGHADVEGGITASKIAILARTKFALIAIERVLSKAGLAFYKRVSAIHENESELVESFQLGMRVIANPLDRYHLAGLLKRWEATVDEPLPATSEQVVTYLRAAAGENNEQLVCVDALSKLVNPVGRLDMKGPFRVLRAFADNEPEERRHAIYSDTEVLLQEWDVYLRATAQGQPTIAGFLSAMALGTTQQRNADGVALLTVHSSKGLEFDVVFVVGMADGVFPDYRAKGGALAEERRNAFVAVTRSKRLLYCSYPKTRRMPWGDTWVGHPSPYLKQLGLR
jgi:DNA helicase II / ATP-dependent DNA helicase PcrA